MHITVFNGERQGFKRDKIQYVGKLLKLDLYLTYGWFFKFYSHVAELFRFTTLF